MREQISNRIMNIKKNNGFTPTPIMAYRDSVNSRFLNKFLHFFKILYFKQKFQGAKNLQYHNRCRGFILFLSLLIMSVALSIAFSVFEIFFFQIVLTGNIKDSQGAFYAADSSLECVYYSDINKSDIPLNGTGKATCNNVTTTFTMTGGIGNFQLFFNNGTCAKVLLDFNNPSPYTHKVQVFGRSKYTGGDCDAPYSRRVERGIEVAY